MEQTISTHEWGVDLAYVDAFGKWHQTSQKSLAAVLHAMEAEPGATVPARERAVIVIRSGDDRPLSSAGVVMLEDGGEIAVTKRLPADLPLGYHQLLLEGASQPVRLIVGPQQCWDCGSDRIWGWAVQLYAARSRNSWGIGDFGDLEKLAQWSAQMGATMMLLNPLSAALPIPRQQASPYYPSSRRFFNPLFLCIRWIKGATGNQLSQLEVIGAEAMALNAQRRIDRDRVFALKMQALDLLWLQFEGDVAFEDFCATRGTELDTYAIFCALAEKHGSGWHAWPEDLRHPSSASVAEFANQHTSRVRFHKWIQWLIDAQLERCARHIGLMQDLPIGFDPDGADAWAWQPITANGASVGAPPDEFNTGGQNWGLPPFVPHKLRQAGYEPFIQTVRAAMRHATGLRVDHVMGLFRLFWIPQGMTGQQGTYVRYDYDEMLTIMALESVRARAYVVGEDLGTVEDLARTQLAARRILSYRLLWFEKDHPRHFAELALSALTTHDLPTVAGLWSGADLARQKELGLQPNEGGTAEICARLRRMAAIDHGDSTADVIAKTYELLAQAPSRILTAALDDAAAVEERPNIPATSGDSIPNWSLALPVVIEDLMEAELPKRIARALGRVN